MSKVSKLNTSQAIKKKESTKTSITNLNNIIQGSKKIVTQKQRKIDRQLEMVHMDVTLEARPGEKICLMGREGSGASSSLLTIRGETELIQGVREIRGDIAYIDLKNQFFVTDLSLRSNIILDEYFDRKRYDEVLKVCMIDLKKFRGGDMIEVIENGNNFSSGERNKILLARFLYVERDIYLFDHYFDELDPKKHLNHFFRVVNTFLKDKTVFYVSNKQQYVKESQRIYVFDDGTVVESGSYNELRVAQNKVFVNIMEIEEKSKKPRKSKRFQGLVNKALLSKMSHVTEPNINSNTKMGLLKLLRRKKKLNTQINPINVDKMLLAELFSAIGKVHQRKEIGKITSEKEEQVNQSLPFLTTTYLFILGKGRIIAMMMLFLVTVLAFMASDIWLGLWSSKSLESFTFMNYFYVYAGISAITVVFVIIRDIVYHHVLRKNSDSLHFKMLRKFFNTSMMWFIKNPSSRVTFRLTRD